MPGRSVLGRVEGGGGKREKEGIKGYMVTTPLR